MPLHAKGQLVARNSRGQLRVAGLQIDLVHFLDQVEGTALLDGIDGGRRLEVQDGTGATAQQRALIDGRQEAGAPAGRAAFRRPFRLRHDAIGRQILAGAAQTVRHP